MAKANVAKTGTLEAKSDAGKEIGIDCTGDADSSRGEAFKTIQLYCQSLRNQLKQFTMKTVRFPDGSSRLVIESNGRKLGDDGTEKEPESK